MSITTRNGDGGRTRLYSGEEVPKDAPEVDACGELDELGTLLGLARLYACRDETQQTLLRLQRALFVVAAEVATTREHLDLLATRVDEDMVTELDRACADLEARIRMPRGFIIPGGTLAGAHLDHARAVARRCERKIIHCRRRRSLNNPALLRWVNRLSDYLWLMARYEEGDDTLPKDA